MWERFLSNGQVSLPSKLQVIKDTPLRMNLKIEHCQGKCYDGATVMSGAKNGVAKQISTDEPRAVYTHSYRHALKCM